MAFLIDKPAPSSVSRPITYWRIIGHSVNYDSQMTRVRVAGYWTAEDRAARMAPVIEKEIVVIVPTGTEPTRAWLYEQLKADPEFAGAADA